MQGVVGIITKLISHVWEFLKSSPVSAHPVSSEDLYSRGVGGKNNGLFFFQELGP